MNSNKINDIIVGTIIISGIVIIAVSLFASVLGYKEPVIYSDYGDCASYERYNCK